MWSLLHIVGRPTLGPLVWAVKNFAQTYADSHDLRTPLASPVAHGPLAVLRRHRRFRPDAEARAAGAAAARRGRADAARLRGGDPAPAPAVERRPAGRRRDLHHPPAPRPLARAAGDDQDVRDARPRA